MNEKRFGCDPLLEYKMRNQGFYFDDYNGRFVFAFFDKKMYEVTLEVVSTKYDASRKEFEEFLEILKEHICFEFAKALMIGIDRINE
jgi:hypothetical protein